MNGMTCSLIELCKPLCHNKAVIHEGVYSLTLDFVFTAFIGSIICSYVFMCIVDYPYHAVSSVRIEPVFDLFLAVSPVLTPALDT